jgi:fused signal recognition particle receptor
MILFRKNKLESGSGSIVSHLQSSLSKTRAVLMTDIRDLFGNNNRSNDELLEALEERLLLADVGVESAADIIDALSDGFSKSRIGTPEEALSLLRERMVSILKAVEFPLEIPEHTRKPFTILVIGVNGAGKTTSIGKLAALFGQYKLTLAAGDTFRAGATEQLKVWGERNNVPVIAGTPGSDSAAVIYDSLVAARSSCADILIADTAGRLQNKSNLIEELKKIRNTITKFDPDLTVETLLVVDAGNGQNALLQAQEFQREIGVNGIVLTKLDGTAKGGIVFALATKLGIPLRFVGIGEGINDIATFNSEDFVSALLD